MYTHGAEYIKSNKRKWPFYFDIIFYIKFYELQINNRTVEHSKASGLRTHSQNKFN